MGEKNKQAVSNESQFSSKWGFILACVGSAVGMANIWSFPYRMSQNGGGSFLIAYLLFIILFSNVALSAEFAIGRRAKTGTLGSYTYAWNSIGKPKVGGTIGFIPLAGSMCIAIGYAVIIAIVLRSFVGSVTGELFKVHPEVFFEQGTKSFSLVPYHFIIVGVTLLTLILGAESIEKSNKVMMPVLVLIFIILAVRVAFLPGASEGYKFMFTPNVEYLTKPMTWVNAMGQAFFSLSVTGSGMIVYGAYLPDNEDVIDGARQTAIFDTLIALLASIVVIPASFAFGQEVGAGPGLMFVTLPTLLAQIPYGRLFSIILFFAVIFAGISSLQNMFEVVGESLLWRFKKLTRNTMLVLLFIICFGIGVFMESIDVWGPWMDIVSIYIIPFGAVLGGISWFWILKKEDLLDEINKGAKKKQGNTWHNIGKFVFVPIAAIVFIVGLFVGGF